MLFVFICWYRRKHLEQTNLAKGVFRSKQSTGVAIKYNYRTCIYFPSVLISLLCYILLQPFLGLFCSKTVNIQYI